MTEVWGGDGTAVAVIIKVNSETVGSAQPTETLSAVAGWFSTDHGLKTFNVLVNGQKADTSQGAQTLAALGATSVELVAEDARG
jgi:hypothetical protein